MSAGGAPRRPGRFRPLVSRRIAKLHQPSRASGDLLCASAFSPSSTQRYGSGVCRQYHSSGILTASGGHPVCDSQPGSAGPSMVGGGALYQASASVHHGTQQCVGGRAFSPASNLGPRMDSQTVGLPSAPLAVASHDRPVCHISESPLYTIFFSHHPNSIGTDALFQQWDRWQAYAFPPYALILAVLKKLHSSSGVLLTLLAPYWPQRPWFPELLELVLDGPVALPLDRNLLNQPHVHRQHLGLSRLALHAWRLSSDL